MFSVCTNYIYSLNSSPTAQPKNLCQSDLRELRVVLHNMQYRVDKSIGLKGLLLG